MNDNSKNKPKHFPPTPQNRMIFIVCVFRQKKRNTKLTFNTNYMQTFLN